MTTTVDLGTKRFETKKEAKAFFSAMLNRYENGDSIKAEDNELLLALLQHHPKVEEKIGSGMKRIYRDKAPDTFLNRLFTDCFYIERSDGSKTDFSFHDCINAIKKQK